MEGEGGGKENSHGIGYQRTDVLLRSACTQNRVMLDSTCHGDGRVSRSVPLSVTGILSQPLGETFQSHSPWLMCAANSIAACPAPQKLPRLSAWLPG